jgi:hypothetical protein
MALSGGRDDEENKPLRAAASQHRARISRGE